MIETKDLVNRAIAHQAVVESSERDIRDNQIRIQQETDKLNTLIQENKTTKFSYEYLDTLIKEESSKFIKDLNDMLNFAVKSIFYDRDYSIEIRVEDNKANIRLKYTDEEGTLIDADIKDCGGGLQTVVGTLIRTYMIYRYKSEPILFLDESLSMVSREYLPNLLTLLDELSKKNDLKILLITHDKRFIDYENVVARYEVKDGVSSEIDIPQRAV